MNRILIFLLAAAVSFGQAAQQQGKQAPRAALNVRVVLEGSERPVEGARVQVSALERNQNGNRLTTTEGTAAFPNLAPGRYRVTAAQLFNGAAGNIEVAHVNLAADATLTQELKLKPAAQVSGRVLDGNDEPVPNIQVSLLGVRPRMFSPLEDPMTYLATGYSAVTDDLGQYMIAGVTPDTTFVLYAEAPPAQNRAAVANTPADPALRRTIRAATFYPSAMSGDASERLRFRSGEKRTDVNIRMVRTPSYCIQGTALPSTGLVPSVLIMDSEQPKSAVFNDYESFRQGQRFRLDASGRFRVCGLSPGSYHAYVQPEAQQSPATARTFYGGAQFLITDRDLDLVLEEQRPVDLTMEAVWDDPSKVDPSAPAPALNVGMGSLGGVNRGGSGGDIPMGGTFVRRNLPLDIYAVSPRPTGNTYVKEITFEGKAVLQRFQLTAGATGQSPKLRFVLGRDGGSATVNVRDRSGPVADRTVVLVPVPGTTVELFDRECVTESDGSCRIWRQRAPTSPPPGPLAPGKYYVVAADVPYNNSIDSVELLKQLIPRSPQITVAPNGTAEITVEPMTAR
jgi:hypothetical protein